MKTNNFSIKVSKALTDIGVFGEYRKPCAFTQHKMEEGHICIVAGPKAPSNLRLDDILRIMPRIGEKVDGAKIEKLILSFIDGDYPKAEQYLLGILKQ